MTDQSLTQPLTLKELNHFIVGELVRGSPEDTVVQYLIHRGWPEITARKYVANAGQLSSEYREVDQVRKTYIWRAKSQMVRGVLWMVSGIGITLISPETFGTSGVMSFIFFGAMALGSLDLLFGFIGWWRSRR